MKRTFHPAKRPSPLAAMVATALVIGLTAAPAALADDAMTPHQVASQDASPAENFADWAQSQADSLDRKFDEATTRAKAMGASASAAARQKWKAARAAIDEQRAALARQLKDLKNATKDQWADAKSATRQTLSDLGDRIDKFQRMVTEDDGPSGKTPAK